MKQLFFVLFLTVLPIFSMESSFESSCALLQYHNELALIKSNRHTVKEKIRTEARLLLKQCKTPAQALEICKKYRTCDAYVGFALTNHITSHFYSTDGFYLPFYEIVWRVEFEQSKKILKKFLETKNSYPPKDNKQEITQAVVKLGKKEFFSHYPGLLAFLLSNDVPSNAYDSDYQSCIYNAIMTDNLEAVKLLIHSIDSSTQVISPTYAQACNLTPFLLAVMEKKYETVQLLLYHKKFSFKDFNWSGDNALACAIRTGSSEMVSLLLPYCKQETLDHTNFANNSVFDIAHSYGNRDILKLMYAHKTFLCNQ